MPLFSIVIRNRNEASTLRRVLAAIQCQTLQDYEVILVDNESDDDSVLIAREAAAKIVTIQRHEFTYGRAINVGIEAASGELILLLSAHSIPLQRDFLDIIKEGFQDEVVAGIRCVQATRKEETLDWHRVIDLDSSASVSDILGWGLNATCCAIRKRVWEKIRFDERIEAAEDKLWTKWALEQGYRVRRLPAIYAYVRTAGRGSALKRNYRESLAAYRAFGIVPKYSILGPLSAMTLGGVKRYVLDSWYTWREYFLLRRVKQDAERESRSGSVW